MATLIFRLSTKASKATDGNEILLRFFHGSFEQRAKTNIFVSPDHWSKERQCAIIPRARVMTPEAKKLVEDLNQVNSKLDELSTLIRQSFIKAGNGKIDLPKNWLSDLIQQYNFPNGDKSLNPFFDVFQRFIDERTVSEVRKRNYEVTLRAFRRFCIFTEFEPTFDNVNPDIIRGFVQFLKDEHSFITVDIDEATREKRIRSWKGYDKVMTMVPECNLPEERGRNTIHKFVSTFRSFYLWLIRNEYTSNNPFKNLDVQQPLYGTPYYLTIEERNQLMGFDFSDRPSLGIQRDIFIFQCVIGCRVSDLRHLTKNSVIDGAVEYIPRKTKDGNPVTVRVPLNKIAKEILAKYADITGNELLPFISDQKYNDDIKEMFKIAGLDRTVTILNPTTGEEEKMKLYEVASSHLARRTFIGNLYKQVQDPNLIGKLSGHAEGSKAFARYRDIDEEMRIDLVKKLE